MKKLLFILFYLNSAILFSQPIYTVPNANKQPKFVFPIYFEEGGGQRDTLYLGYDSMATGNGVGGWYDDSIFGVKSVWVDTNLFYAGWTDQVLKSYNPPILKDSLYKINVSKCYTNNSGQLYFPFIHHISVNRGILPLKISWDKNLFYSDSLPFIITLSTPVGEGHFIVQYSSEEAESENGNVICYNYPYIILTDSIVNSMCTANDSFTIFNVNQNIISVNEGILNFSIQGWTGVNTIIHELTNDINYFEVNPNPFNNNLIIKSKSLKSEIRVYDILGKIIYKNLIVGSMQHTLFTSEFKSGIYIVKIFSDENIFEKKLIKY